MKTEKETEERRAYKDIEMIGNRDKKSTYTYQDGYPGFGRTIKIHYGDDWMKNQNIADWKLYSWRDENLAEIMTFFGTKGNGGFAWGKHSEDKSENSIQFDREQVLAQALQDALMRGSVLLDFIEEFTGIMVDSAAWINKKGTYDGSCPPRRRNMFTKNNRTAMSELVELMETHNLPAWDYHAKRWMEEEE